MYTSRIVLTGALLLVSFASVAGKASFNVGLVVEDACRVDAARLSTESPQSLARPRDLAREVSVSCVAESPYAVTVAAADVEEDAEAMTLTVSY